MPPPLSLEELDAFLDRTEKAVRRRLE